MFDQTRKFLAHLGMPIGDLYDLPTSNKSFSDGSQFRIEIPTVNSIQACEALLNESIRLGIHINRITETQGIFRYLKQDIKTWLSMCRGYGCDLVMSVGPRATYDTGASANSDQGKTIGYRLRGQEQLVRAIEDVKHGIELGVKHFLIYDEGMLYVLNKMRQLKEIPSNIHFKISAHCGHCNPASFMLLEQLGANSINPVRDLQLPMIAALRQTINVPLDCHTDNPPSSGGFMRLYEAPEIVRIAAPVYLKTGNSVVARHGQVITNQDGEAMAHQAALVIEMLDRYLINAIQTKPKSMSLEPVRVG